MIAMSTSDEHHEENDDAKGNDHTTHTSTMRGNLIVRHCGTFVWISALAPFFY